MRDRRDEHDGSDDGGHQRKGLRVSERTVEPPGFSGEDEDRQEADHRGGNGGEHRPGDLGGGAVNGLQSGFTRRSIVEVIEDVFREHDAHIHDGADGDGDAGKCDDVGIDAEELHGDEGDEHGERQHGANEQAAAQVHEHDHDDDDGDEHLLAERVFQGA